MNKKTVENLIKEMENTQIFMTDQMTYCEYTESLIQFQNMVTRMVMGNRYEEGMRVDEAIFRLEAKARAKGLGGDQKIRKGISALKLVQKELSISIAGKKGEDITAKTLMYVTRPNTSFFRNIYISVGEDETELDAVVVTDAGIIILENKNTKNDLIITEDGRLLHNGNECFEKKPLGGKMVNKRRLLQERIKEEMSERNLNIPVVIDSMIVFSVPKDVRIFVDDRLRSEKWCFRTSLNHKIDSYYGNVTYTNEQIEIFNEILSQFESQNKRFSLTVDFNIIRRDLAEALIALDDDTSNFKVKETAIEMVNKKQVSNGYVCGTDKKTKSEETDSRRGYIALLFGSGLPRSIATAALTIALAIVPLTKK